MVGSEPVRATSHLHFNAFWIILFPSFVQNLLQHGTYHLLFIYALASYISVTSCCFLKVWDREKVVIIPDHYIFTKDERANRNVDILRDFVKEQNIKYFYDITDRSDFKVCCLLNMLILLSINSFRSWLYINDSTPAQVNPDYKGVCHVALAQEGHCRPGEVYGPGNFVTCYFSIYCCKATRLIYLLIIGLVRDRLSYM